MKALAPISVDYREQVLVRPAPIDDTKLARALDFALNAPGNAPMLAFMQLHAHLESNRRRMIECKHGLPMGTLD